MKMTTVFWSSKILPKVTARPFSSRTSILETVAISSLVGMSLGNMLMLDHELVPAELGSGGVHPGSDILTVARSLGRAALAVHWSDFVGRSMNNYGNVFYAR